MPAHSSFRLQFLPLVMAPLMNGQTTISATDHHAFAANAGWIDFRTTVGDGVRVTDTFLAGYAYAANFGWIHFGSGHPGNGHSYANGVIADYGVNMNPAGELTGCAYAPNVGYIQFEQAYGKPRIDPLTGIFHGAAYSANLGWISLETPSSALATTSISRPDVDGDGIPDPWEELHFGNLTNANATTDADGDGATDLSEYTSGTDPQNATSHFRITSHSYAPDRTSATLTFTVVPNRLYRIEHGTTLAGAWTDSPLGLFTPDPGPTTTRNITVPSVTARFFRASAVPALP